MSGYGYMGANGSGGSVPTLAQVFPNSQLAANYNASNAPSATSGGASTPAGPTGPAYQGASQMPFSQGGLGSILSGMLSQQGQGSMLGNMSLPMMAMGLGLLNGNGNMGSMLPLMQHMQQMRMMQPQAQMAQPAVSSLPQNWTPPAQIQQQNVMPIRTGLTPSMGGYSGF